MVGELGPRVHALQLGNKGMESKQYCNKFNTEFKKKKKRIFLHALIPALSFFLFLSKTIDFRQRLPLGAKHSLLVWNKPENPLLSQLPFTTHTHTHTETQLQCSVCTVPFLPLPADLFHKNVSY